MEYRTANAGVDDSWKQTVRVPYYGTTPGVATLTPKNGKLVISYVDDDGATRYWNGTAFAVSAEVLLATTIVGTQSTYTFVPPAPELSNRTAHFEGWINGFRSVANHVFVDYRGGAAPALEF